MIPEITVRSSTRRAPGWFLGIYGSIAAHCASVSQNRCVMKASNRLIERLESDLLTQINTVIGF